MAEPDFLILGCQKGGTTTLYDLLCRHPRVLAARSKEVQYFSLHHGRGPEWYRSFFPDQEGSVTGEASPYYLFHPLAARRIAEEYPDVRLIVLLRDPVERTLSQYFHSRRLGLEPLDLTAALLAESDRLAGAEEVLARGDAHDGHREHSYVSRSRYDLQLRRFADHFPTEQLLVLRSEDLFASPELVCTVAWRHLGLPPTPLGPVHALNAGRGERVGVPDDVVTMLETQLSGERPLMERWIASHGQPEVRSADR